MERSPKCASPHPNVIEFSYSVICAGEGRSVKFFFPDSQDYIDPSFNFVTESRSSLRVRQRDDRYAHEEFSSPPFDGLLISRAVVDSGRYTLAQKHRLLRVGLRSFFRLQNRHLETMGDCGAFSYAREQVPPYSVGEIISFYDELGFDYGLSVDHVILGFKSAEDNIDPEWKRRQEITLELANEFIREHQLRDCTFTPIGVAQGWSPASYAFAVAELQRMGYRYIALGGMVPLKTADILSCLEEIKSFRQPDVRLHLLGITRCEQVREFEKYGVASFDSTSPLRQAFKDLKDNYYAPDRTYSAIRVPQVQANPELSRRILAGKIHQGEAQRLERACLQLLSAYDNGSESLEDVLDTLRSYELLFDEGSDRTEIYREVLVDKPWKACPCDICKRIGIHVIIFRGAERNRRRGFHNIFVFYHRLHKELSNGIANVPIFGSYEVEYRPS